MFLNLLASFFFSNKIYMAASLNRHYIPGKRALLIVLMATFLDDIAYYCFDSKYALSNYSFIFYLLEIVSTCFVVALLSRIVGCSARQCTFSAIFKGYSYTLSPVIFGSILIIIISLVLNAFCLNGVDVCLPIYILHDLLYFPFSCKEVHSFCNKYWNLLWC